MLCTGESISAVTTIVCASADSFVHVSSRGRRSSTLSAWKIGVSVRFPGGTSAARLTVSVSEFNGPGKMTSRHPRIATSSADTTDMLAARYGSNSVAPVHTNRNCSAADGTLTVRFIDARSCAVPTANNTNGGRTSIVTAAAPPERSCTSDTFSAVARGGNGIVIENVDISPMNANSGKSTSSRRPSRAIDTNEGPANCTTLFASFDALTAATKSFMSSVPGTLPSNVTRPVAVVFSCSTPAPHVDSGVAVSRIDTTSPAMYGLRGSVHASSPRFALPTNMSFVTVHSGVSSGSTGTMNVALGTTKYGAAAPSTTIDNRFGEEVGASGFNVNGRLT